MLNTELSQYASADRRKKRTTPVSVILLELFLLAAATAACLLFLSFLPVSIKYEYTVTTKPVPSPASAACTGEETLDEADIPVIEPKPKKRPYYDYASPVPEGFPHTLDYFDDAVFIGDSRMMGLTLYTKLNPYDYTATGLNVSQALSKSFIRTASGATCTILDALKLEKGNFHSVYISIGVNELGGDPGAYQRNVRKMIEQLRTVTDVPIYMQLITPVTHEAEETSRFGVTNAKVAAFNEKLTELAEEMKFFLLDPNPLFVLDDGTLDPTLAFDGIHMLTSAYNTLAQYYASHVVEPTDYLDWNSETEETAEAPGQET